MSPASVYFLKYVLRACSCAIRAKSVREGLTPTDSPDLFTPLPGIRSKADTSFLGTR